jgi:hypothetical protein
MNRSSIDRPFTLYYKVTMKTFTRAVAVAELLFVFPAVLFMTALFLRAVQPALRTGRFVEWFATIPVEIGLYLMLVALPLGAFVIGCATLLRIWRRDAGFREAALRLLTLLRAHLATLLIATVTVASGVILALVAMHMITE